MYEWAQKIRQSKYFRRLAILTSGSFIGMFFIAIRQILQTRIFTVEEIGIYVFLIAIPEMFIGIISLRYDIAIITERNFHRSLVLVKLAICTSVVMGTLITACYTVYILCNGTEGKQ